MNRRKEVAAVVEAAIEKIRQLPLGDGGDENEFADMWQSIKDQRQHEESFLWSAIEEACLASIEGIIADLPGVRRVALAAELYMEDLNEQEMAEHIWECVLSRADDEPIEYRPFPYQYVSYEIEGLTAYAEILARTGLTTCEVCAYSEACPEGEDGELDTSEIIDILTPAQFAKIQEQGWNESVPAPKTFGCRKCWGEDAAATWRWKCEPVDVIQDDSHFKLWLCACPQCGQMFVRIFTEFIDWEDGNDPQYRDLMPLTKDEAEYVRAHREPAPLQYLEALSEGRRHLAGGDSGTAWSNSRLWIVEGH